MKVIGAGFGRTGTMSLKAALEQLGCGPCYHMIDLIRDPSRAPGWIAAAGGERVDWRELLRGYEATVDWPGCSFYRQLIETWPDAKVLLTVRDPDAWYESCRKSIYAAVQAGRRGELAEGSDAPLSPDVMRAIGAIVWEGDLEGRFEDRDYAIEIFNRHNDDVRRAVPPEKLVVHEISDGWEPLCRLLGVDVPSEPFPRLNDTAAFREMMGLPPLGG